MSIESARAFLERVQNDEDFRKTVGEIATAEERMEFVQGAGFDFTKEEIKSDQVERSLTRCSYFLAECPDEPCRSDWYEGCDNYH
jgi:predicted ribosomally synthesized peptide with nif11-like leader